MLIPIHKNVYKYISVSLLECESYWMGYGGQAPNGLIFFSQNICIVAYTEQNLKLRL